ncbi:MAG TPA: lipid-A-disaccharide synthase [Thermoanaerobaculia bacterium]|jgi:lipid-A-disaccharide synthase|nr:lipid-A-disaccharide synthase [Thermoanaerobaculia bacterium]
MQSNSRELLIVAGEASGDLHGARLISELRQRVPGLAAFGLGGDEMQAAGLQSVAHSSEVAVVGITEVLKVLPRIREVFADLLHEVDRRRPALAVLIDFPDFNLRLARQLKERGLEIVYYISPQVWAWRKGRVKTIARLVDRMLVLFPFEVDFYRGHGVDVIHVGHPLVDEVPVLPQVWDREGSGEGPFRVALLPGSRLSEVEALLPTLLAAVRRLAGQLPVEARIIRAPTVPRELLDEAVELSGLTVAIVESDRFAAVADSHVALCASGTATLEVGLLGTPMVVVYRLASWTYLLARLLVRLPNVALVNLVLGRRVVPELIQGQANPERIAAEAARLLTDAEARGEMRTALAEVRCRLGAGGASGRAAGEVAEMLAEATSN